MSGIVLRTAPQIKVEAPMHQQTKWSIAVMFAVPIRLLPMVVAPMSTIIQVRKNSNAMTKMKKKFFQRPEKTL